VLKKGFSTFSLRIVIIV